MPGRAMPLASRWLPLVRPWSDSTRPIAATSCRGRLHVLSAALMTVSARWYAASAAEGMPEVDALATAWWVLPLMPGATTPGTETLAGALMASVGTLVPSGSVVLGFSEADASLTPTPAMLAVQAAESSASGTRAVAFWIRPKRGADIEISLWSNRRAPSSTGEVSTICVTPSYGDRPL